MAAATPLQTPNGYNGMRFPDTINNGIPYHA
jgi:hypothetical protein